MEKRWWKRKGVWVAAAVAATLAVPAGFVNAQDSASPVPAESSVARNGQLEVCGTQLCNESREPVQLRGMSTHGLQWYEQCVNDASMDALAGDWNADVIRASMYIAKEEDGYETDPERFTALMNKIIDEATERGLYVIVDWHMLDPGDPNRYTDIAKDFFAKMAEKHADKTNVIYELANEPNGVSWSDIKGYHEQVLPVIREKDPDSLVLLGTRAWSSLGVSEGADESEIVDDPVDGENIMYTFHFYAASHGDEYLDTLDRASDKLPMFVTEFGTQEATGDGGNDFDMSQRYLDLMAQKKISWTNWNFSDDQRSGAVFEQGTCPDGPFDASNLKPAGEWIHGQLAGGQ
ncbi:Cellulase [Stackebrandtia nassauensis DSM 44728]|uniref:cellulase n=1 Tax=Stackebrandtia nassauensis (strain DSM 44728 / CIP 108903 / NRRL B-16338 / NBRC 102104 / LLR-40K-21) TaxID=446470 RepID=D3PZG3_STANL|nr:glycoside hydrolase family 5 protein [Stackebrandtia nassauensis]ADD41637.1 Cellulase [Stackebrandtia nassauensis DSM 44728]